LGRRCRIVVAEEQLGGWDVERGREPADGAEVGVTHTSL